MSELERLIQELCPNGVIHKRIADIADTFIGLATSVTKHKVDNGVLLLHNSDIKEGRIELKTIEYISEDFAQKNAKKILHKNDIITVHTGDVGTSAVITDDYEGAIGFTTITSRVKNNAEITPDFLCRYLNSHLCKEQIAAKTISDRNNLNLAAFDELKVPIPPRPIQDKIVETLDNLTAIKIELIDKLEAELLLRKKQFAFYCSNALRFNEDAPKVKLMEIATYSKDRVSVENLTAENYVSVENLLQNKAGKRNADKVPSGTGNVSGYLRDDILIGNIRPYLKKIWLADCDGGTNGDVLVIRTQNKQILLPQYLHSVLSSDDFFDYDTNNSKGAKMPRGDKAAVMQYEFSLPSIEKQRKAIDVLTALNAVYNGIFEELSAEIEARQKQYEYYRDKLLTFKELSE